MSGPPEEQQQRLPACHRRGAPFAGRSTSRGFYLLSKNQNLDYYFPLNLEQPAAQVSFSLLLAVFSWHSAVFGLRGGRSGPRHFGGNGRSRAGRWARSNKRAYFFALQWPEGRTAAAVGFRETPKSRSLRRQLRTGEPQVGLCSEGTAVWPPSTMCVCLFGRGCFFRENIWPDQA